jgi:hypothetical protein
MMRGGRRRPWRFAALVAFIFFGAFSLLPVWQAAYIGEWETTSGSANFWTMAASLNRAALRFGINWVADHYWFEPIKTIVVFAASLAIGRAISSRLEDRARSR